MTAHGRHGLGTESVKDNIVVEVIKFSGLSGKTEKQNCTKNDKNACEKCKFIKCCIQTFFLIMNDRLKMEYLEHSGRIWMLISKEWKYDSPIVRGGIGKVLWT